MEGCYWTGMFSVLEITLPNSASQTNRPFTLLESTFNPDPEQKQLSENVIAFARVFHAIEAGNLTVNGLPPDNSYSLGEYLIHGGRIRFDLSELDLEHRDLFFKYITNSDTTQRHIIQRKFASHLHGGTDANGNITEIKSHLRAWWSAKNRSKHLGINLPIGGEGSEYKDQKITTDGNWGHMYIYDDHAVGIMMVGIQNSAPLQRNVRTLRYHNPLATSGTTSSFYCERLQDKSWHQHLSEMRRCPLTVKQYNWACVKITDNVVNDLVANPLLLDTEPARENFIRRLRLPPKNAYEVTDPAKRLDQMEKFQKATRAKAKARNAKNSRYGKWAAAGGVVLTVIGLALSLSPFPPGVAQAIGGTLAGIGIKTIASVALTMTLPAILGNAVYGVHREHLDNAIEKWNKAKNNWIEAKNEADQDAAVSKPVVTTDKQDLLNSKTTVIINKKLPNCNSTSLSKSLPDSQSPPDSPTYTAPRRRLSDPGLYRRSPIIPVTCAQEAASEASYLTSPTLSLVE